MTFAANDKIRHRAHRRRRHGLGRRRDALRNPGVELVAAADIYDGRLARIKERLGQRHLLRTARLPRNARPQGRRRSHRRHTRPLARQDLHRRHERRQRCLLREADGPEVEEGKRVIEAQQEDRPHLAGRQPVCLSALLSEDQRNFSNDGAIGELNMVEAWLDRNTAIGAWQYSIPPDATPDNIDWDRFLGTRAQAPLRAHPPLPLAQLPGLRHRPRRRPLRPPADRTAHRHRLARTQAHLLRPAAPLLADGRDVPDTMLGIIEYPKSATHPEFTFMLRVISRARSLRKTSAFASSAVADRIFTDVMRNVTLTSVPRESEPGYTIDTFSKKRPGRVPRTVPPKVPAPTPDSRRHSPGQGTALPQSSRLRSAPGAHRTSSDPSAITAAFRRSDVRTSAPLAPRCSATPVTSKAASATGTPAR